MIVMNCGCVKALIDIGYLLSKNNIITKIMIILNKTKWLSLISNANIGKKVLLDFTKGKHLISVIFTRQFEEFRRPLTRQSKVGIWNSYYYYYYYWIRSEILIKLGQLASSRLVLDYLALNQLF